MDFCRNLTCNFTWNVCSQCGERYFDDEVMEKLEKIIDDVKKISVEISVVRYDEVVA